MTSFRLKNLTLILSYRLSIGATILSITKFSIMTFSIKSLYDIQHKWYSAQQCSALMPSGAFYLLSFSWRSLCCVSLRWVSLRWRSLCWLSLCWVSLRLNIVQCLILTWSLKILTNRNNVASTACFFASWSLYYKNIMDLKCMDSLVS